MEIERRGVSLRSVSLRSKKCCLTPALPAPKPCVFVLSFSFDIAYAKEKERYQRKRKHRDACGACQGLSAPEPLQ